MLIVSNFRGQIGRSHRCVHVFHLERSNFFFLSIRVRAHRKGGATLVNKSKFIFSRVDPNLNVIDTAGHRRWIEKDIDIARYRRRNRTKSLFIYNIYICKRVFNYSILSWTRRLFNRPTTFYAYPRLRVVYVFSIAVNIRPKYFKRFKYTRIGSCCVPKWLEIPPNSKFAYEPFKSLESSSYHSGPKIGCSKLISSKYLSRSNLKSINFYF